MSGPAEIPGIRVEPLGVPESALTIQIEAGHVADALNETDLARVDDAWRAMCAQNPRLFDGPLLSVVSADAAQGRIVCRHASYRFLAVQPEISTGATLLGVNGIVTAHDAAGTEHLLLARRGRRTRVYPGLWECAPAGGVERADGAGDALGAADVLDALAEEAIEELGEPMDVSGGRILAMCLDERAPSRDLIVRLKLVQTIDPGAAPCAEDHWEYTESAWVPLDQLPAFLRAEADSVSPMTHALIRHLGWA